MVIVALMAGHVPAAQDRRCRDVRGGDSATDGDFDVAYGLLLAHAQWGSGGAIDYLGAARRLLAGALEEDVPPRTGLTTLGDWTGPGSRWSGTRPSDWMLGHFRAFGAATGEPRWERVRRTVLRLVRRVPRRSGLLPDFVVRGRPAVGGGARLGRRWRCRRRELGH